MQVAHSLLYQKSEHPVSKGTHAWVRQHTRSPSRNGKKISLEMDRTGTDFSRGTVDASKPPTCGAAAQNNRSRAAKELVNRMIGIQDLPYRRVGRLGPGQYFGERACWTGEKRTASVVTITSAELYCLQRSTLQAAAKLWPDLECQLSLPVLGPTSSTNLGVAALRSAGYKRSDSNPGKMPGGSVDAAKSRAHYVPSPAQNLPASRVRWRSVDRDSGGRKERSLPGGTMLNGTWEPHGNDILHQQ